MIAAKPQPTKRKRKKPGRAVAIPPGVAPGRGGQVKGSKKRGQPAFVPTLEQRTAVMGLVSIGTEHWVIAEALGLPEATMYRHFKDELQKGRGIIHGRVGGGIVAAALEGNLTAQIFYAKAQMGWRDRYNIGFDDEKGNPVNPSNLFQINITG